MSTRGIIFGLVGVDDKDQICKTERGEGAFEYGISNF